MNNTTHTPPAHTPGAWHVFTEDAKRAMIRDNDDRWLATVRIDDQADVDEQEAEANARLMSAAPELLGACKQILALFAQEIDEDQDIPAADFLEDFLATRPCLVESIAKAEGR